ncbi:hypothetical protein K2X33_05070 [bacterium]|nr:hypothetical protein [bacterium]
MNRGFFLPILCAALIPCAAFPAWDTELQTYLLKKEQGRIHEAWDVLNALEEQCAAWRGSQFAGVEKGSAAGVCAWASAEHLATAPFPWDFRRPKLIRSDILLFQTEEVPQERRLFLTGFLRGALPPLQGQDFRASLVSWRFLERLAPETPEMFYGLGLVYTRQGNTQAAEEAFGQAADKGSALVAARRERHATQGRAEPSTGFAPYVFNSPAWGLGAGARFWDDRVADTFRQFNASASFATRGLAQGRAEWMDGEMLSPLRLVVAGDIGVRPQNLGAGSFSWRWAQAELGAQAALGHALLGLGYTLHSASYSGLPVTAAGYGFQALRLELEWDTRERPELPSQGFRLQLGQSWAVAFSGGASFSQSRARLSGWWSPGVRTLVGVTAVAVVSQGSVPQGKMPDLAYDLGVPGVVPWRFQQPFGAGAWAFYRYTLLSWLRPGVFASVAWSGAGLAQGGRPHWGAGIDFQFPLQRDPRAVPRWEVAVFDGAWVFQGGMEFTL